MPKNSSRELQVERAIADFRGGYPVVIMEGEALFLVQGIENLSLESLKALDDFAVGKARLVLSSIRLKKLKLPHQDIGSIALSNLDKEAIDRLALFADAQTDNPVIPPVWIDRVALELAHLSLVAPAVIVVPVSANTELDPSLLRIQAEDIRRYRQQNSRQITLISRAPVPLEGAPETEFIVFRGGEGLRDQVAIIVGKPDFSRPVFVRLHSACLTGDLFGSLKCDCGDQLRFTTQYMAQHEGGVLLYLDQEGRGNGIANKIRAYKLQAQGMDTFEADEVIGFDMDQRRFDFAADMLRQLGITHVRLMTNNPLKISALRQAGIDVVSDLRVFGRETAENKVYLETKRKQAGHMLEVHGSLCPRTED